MAIAKQKKLYQFFLHPVASGGRTIGELLSHQGELTKSGGENTVALFTDLAAIHDMVERHDEQSDRWVVDQSVVNFLDGELCKEYLVKPNDKQLGDLLFVQVELLAAATDNIPGLLVYSPEDFRKIFLGEIGTYDDRRFVHTLRQALHGIDTLQYAEKILAVLSVERDKTMFSTYEWKDALKHALFLHVVWAAFPLLRSDDDKILLLQHYLFRGIFCGVPVRNIFQKMLQQSIDAADYILKDKFLVDALASSKEKIPVSFDKQSEELLANTIRNYKNQAGEKSLEKTKQKSFVAQLYHSSQEHSRFVEALEEVLDITLRLQQASLISFYRKDEKTDAEKYFNDLLQLISWFFEPKGWDKIIEYYKKKNGTVPLSNYLKRFADSMDLSDEKNMQRILLFSQLLREHKLLDRNIELIEFHEDDDKFHWNEQLYGPHATA